MKHFPSRLAGASGQVPGAWREAQGSRAPEIAGLLDQGVEEPEKRLTPASSALPSTGAEGR